MMERKLKKIYSFFECDESEADKAMENLIVDAIETGIGYWCGFWPGVTGSTEFYSVNVWETIRRGETLEFGEEDEDGERGKINIDTILNAFHIIMKKYPRVYADIREQNYDCEIADFFFQMCVFGEIVFG